MQKRGSFSLRLVLELVLSALLIFSSMSLARGLGTQQFFVKQSIAEESVLIIHALQSLPGNIVFLYPKDMSSYTVQLEDHAVIVDDKREAFSGAVKPETVSNSKTLYFYKNGNEISIAAAEPRVSQRECQPARLDRNNLRIEAPPAVQAVASSIGFPCSNDVCAADALSKSTTLSLSPAREGAAAFFSGETNRHIACNLLNGMLARNPQLETWLVPSDDLSLRIEVAPASIESLGRVVQESS
ncbi:MAG TPA: hypothetical protein VJH88_03585 [Candidatus Nanoarchaeia archaeon]|nr:hypothetical protein [Candidatus Nanoarchaeia archaeon]